MLIGAFDHGTTPLPKAERSEKRVNRHMQWDNNYEQHKLFILSHCINLYTLFFTSLCLSQFVSDKGNFIADKQYERVSGGLQICF